MSQKYSKAKTQLKIKRNKLTPDVFVSQIYHLHIIIRKRIWKIDERIARQHISPTFGDRPLSEFERGEVEDWLSGLRESGLASASCNHFLAVFKTLCSVAETRGFIQHGASPCFGVSPFKVHAKKERYLSQDEAQRLTAALEKSDRIEALALRLLLLTGARKRETIRERWENVNLEQRIITVPLSKSGTPRSIVLSEAAIQIIKEIPQSSGSP